MKDLYDLLQIKANTSTAWHPQTDGQTERVNEEVEKYLRIFINHLQDDWVEWLSLTAFAHNNCIHSTTGKAPSRLTMAITPMSSQGADEPPGSVRSEFADLAIHHPIPSKRHHYNPHTLDNTTDFRSISHKHSDTILEP